MALFNDPRCLLSYGALVSHLLAVFTDWNQGVVLLVSYQPCVSAVAFQFEVKLTLLTRGLWTRTTLD